MQQQSTSRAEEKGAKDLRPQKHGLRSLRSGWACEATREGVVPEHRQSPSATTQHRHGHPYGATLLHVPASRTSWYSPAGEQQEPKLVYQPRNMQAVIVPVSTRAKSGHGHAVSFLFGRPFVYQSDHPAARRRSITSQPVRGTKNQLNWIQSSPAARLIVWTRNRPWSVRRGLDDALGCQLRTVQLACLRSMKVALMTGHHRFSPGAPLC